MAVAKHLLEILRCPESLGELLYFASSEEEKEFLFCPASKLKYRIDEGIPVMLIEEALRLDEEACKALEARARA